MGVESTGKRFTGRDVERIERNRIGREDVGQVDFIGFSLASRTEISRYSLPLSLERPPAMSQMVWHGR